MPLFGVTIGLCELRDRVATILNCGNIAAEAILFRKLRRGEITAFCEWAYAVGGVGQVLISHQLSTEPWILAHEVNWEENIALINSKAAQEITHAVDIYFWTADLDFLDEKHYLEEVMKEIPKRGRRPGTGFEKADAPFVERIVSLVRNGTAPSANAAAQIVVDADEEKISGGGGIESKVDRLRAESVQAAS